MDSDTILLGVSTIALVFSVLVFSFSFQTPYRKELRFLARQPFFRLFAYFLILLGMDWHPVIGILTFLFVVFWFYDVSLLSAI